MTAGSAVLAWGRDLVEPALRAAVAQLPPSMRPLARHHFGWDGDQAGKGGLEACPQRGCGGSVPTGNNHGKAIRPAVVLLAARAVGAPEPALPAAVAIELVHNFSLLHDDVMDGDDTRRHRPTVWKLFGVGPAILAGDALITVAAQVLAASGHPAAGEGLRMLTGAVLELVEGQSADLAFEQRDDVEPAECRAMAEGKTGALLGCAAALGALFGGGCPEQVHALGGFGRKLGLAFQFVDDLLGIWGEPAKTGKPVYSDLRNRKKSLPVVAALCSGTPEGAELAALYRNPEILSNVDLARAARLVELAGGRAWAREEAEDLRGRALADLHAACPDPAAARDLELLAHLTTSRSS